MSKLLALSAFALAAASTVSAAINCQQYPDTAFCIKARAQWAAEQAAEADQEQMVGAPACKPGQFCIQNRIAPSLLEEQEQMMRTQVVGGPKCKPGFMCIQNLLEQEPLEEEQMMRAQVVGGPKCGPGEFCIQNRQRPAIIFDEEEQMIGGPKCGPGEACIGASIQRPAGASPTHQYRIRRTILDDDEEQVVGGPKCGPGEFCITRLEEENEQMIRGALNCQAYPNAPFCIKARAQWAAEQATLLEEEQALAVGPRNCKNFPSAPSCRSQSLRGPRRRLE